MATKPSWLTEAKLEHIKTGVANPVDTLTLIRDAMQMVIDGYNVEKLSNKGEVVDIVDKLPGALAQLVKAQLSVLQYLDSQLESDSSGSNGVCQLTIVMSEGSNERFNFIPSVSDTGSV